MSEGELVMAAQALLLLAAWYWHGGTDRLIYALMAAFVASAWAAQTFTGIDRHVALAALDAAIVAFASKVWIANHDMRGWTIGLIGFAKIGGRLSVASLGPVVEPHISHWAFAAAMNLAFMAQVIVAGGMVDVVGGRIADHIRRAGPRRARLLRNVEGR